jgi:glyoxylase-like metal-dependent hydrolase (beta-lactamase superfamily II)
VVRPIDLMHLGRPNSTAVYLLEEPEPAILDCGPATCVEALKAGLARHGLALTDLRHVLLTHIHPDHAGAAGALVREHPALQVHVSEVGAPHLVDPTRLERSARRVFGDEFDRLFGPIAPVPAENVHVLGDHALELEVVPTPGHAYHHVAFFDAEGTCYAGDVAGILIPPSRFLYPATPPPEVDLPAWERSLDELELRRPAALYLAHFGPVGDPAFHLARMRERLLIWADRVREGWSEERFVAEGERELEAEAGEDVRLTFRLQPGFSLSYAGLKRYFDRKAEKEGGS